MEGREISVRTGGMSKIAVRDGEPLKGGTEAGGENKREREAWEREESRLTSERDWLISLLSKD